MLSENIFEYDEIVNLYIEQTPNIEDEQEEMQEVFEWWACNDWLIEKLKEQGEPILETDYGSWWGRTCSGQAIKLDSVIEAIFS